MNQPEKPQNDKYEHPTFRAEEFLKDDYMRLWQYFSDRADMLKDRLWTISTWLLGFNSAILGFIFGTPLIAFDSSGSTVGAPAFVLALALAGCALCLYAFVLINDYGKHIQRNWDRADVLKEKLPLVKEALAGNSIMAVQRRVEQKAGLPKIAKYLFGFALVYFVVFLTIAALSYQRLQ